MDHAEGYSVDGNNSKSIIIEGNKQPESSSSSSSSMTASISNLVNNVAGAGILTLSAGVAKGTGWMQALLICGILGAMSSHTFALIGEACHLTGETDFKGLWGVTIGQNSAYLVDLLIAVMCFAVTVIYIGILGDVFTPLLASVGLPDAMNGRTTNILAISTFALLPLSLIQNLSALAFTSTLGFASVLYTVAFVLLRSLDGTYALGTGKFVVDQVSSSIIQQPSFVHKSTWNLNFAALVLASNLGLAYVAHYNGPIFYRELEDACPKKFGKMVHIAFGILTALYTVIMLAGYFTFGDVTQGNILLNYHPSDMLSTLARFATGLSILFGFPLVMVGVVEGFAGVLSSRFGIDRTLCCEKRRSSIIVMLLSIVTFLAITVQDVSFVVGLTGAAFGSFIVYILPVTIYCKSVGLAKGFGSLEHQRAKRNYFVSYMGTFLGVVGVYMTIKDYLG
eukprot:CAMPEP_0196808268 /NCGR_PEP_ID=MMETSP1362-20130617/8269_1 /TAXON_ID=163516 /ORGANISM="Leptocylindrus danicus, Strain CCMP1856" /LENGTH=450 /DNA_ID=CAMNT_0042182549 /DNA_START=384 /DNA_END=1736 /DNA_ORIENTATION=+